jgi:hypothetical protein
MSATHPRRVAQVFRLLDKLLKRHGNKRLVFEIADLSINAAQRAIRDEEVIQGEAVALICGRSRVLQRISRLAEARVAAEKSLQLGQDIGWDRNTAYCKKCIGRLYRLEAEREQGERRTALLTQSIGFLNHLFRRPVPAELRRGKMEGIEKGREAAFHLGKGFIQDKLLAQMRLALEPHILGRILLRGVRSKAHTGHFPVGLGQATVRLCEKLLDLFPSVIPRTVPEIE